MSTPVKTVFTEYYLMEWLDLIGIIGGTLGLMIGFSFMGSVTSIVDMIFDFKQHGAAKEGNKPKSRVMKIRNRHRKFYSKAQKYSYVKLFPRSSKGGSARKEVSAAN